MPELRVVALRICGTWRGFGGWVERFGGFGLPVGCGVSLGVGLSGFVRLVRVVLGQK